MAKKTKTNLRLTKELLEMADGMRNVGLMDDAAHKKITLRHLGEAERIVRKSLTGQQIKSLREKANISQAVLAQYLHVTVGYISQLERGARRPSGPALVLLDVIRRKGIEAIL